MTRTSGRKDSCHEPAFSTHMAQQRSNGGKRSRQQTGMARPAAYTCDTTPHWTGHVDSARPTLDDVTVYEVQDYVTQLSSSPNNASRSTAKRQRIEAGYDGTNHPQTSSLAISYPYRVSPSTSIASDLSATPSFIGLSDDDVAMSRQSSVTTASIANGVDMMRVESDFSACSDNSGIGVFPFEFDPSAFSLESSCLTEKPSSSAPITGFDDGNVFSSMGCGFDGMQDFPLYDVSQSVVSNATTVQGVSYCNEQQGLAVGYIDGQEMLRSLSNDSHSSVSSAELKANERRRRHVENAKQPIASKVIPEGPISAEHSKNRPLKPQAPGTQRKEAITKAPYVRPQHPKLTCSLCNEHPQGFRGEHELRRHWERAHAQVRKVWICIDPGINPANPDDWRPTRPVDICKQCKNRKQYGVYYNAAAHLRRAHFCPRKRGRKARGEKRESRAGKAGGDWPPIEWLKANGWLQEIEVGATDDSTQDFGADIKDEEFDDFEDEQMPYDTTPPDPALEAYHINLSAQQLGFDAYAPPVTSELQFGYPMPIAADFQYSQLAYAMQSQPQLPYHQPVQAPVMEHTYSAPPAMMTMNHGSIYNWP